MGIRWIITDRSTGEVTTLDNPVAREFVKDGVRKALPPKREDVEGFKARLKHDSRLGMSGGCLA